MKHGIKLGKLQRTPSHRWALLRNLVSALLHHESIKTTLPKAKEAARMAEKIITLGKKGTDPARRSAMAFLMPSHSYNPASTSNGPIAPPRPTGYPSTTTSSDPNANPEDFIPPTTLLPKLFSTLSTRYATRSGGYTRIHKFGRRPGDNAPHAILELVDGPRDLKFEMTARAIGRESAQYAAERGGVEGMSTQQGREWEGLRERTEISMNKVLKFREEEGRRELDERAARWTDRLMAEERGSGGIRRLKAGLENKTRSDAARTPEPYEGRRYKSGERMSGMTISHTGLGLARADLGRTFRNGNPDKRPRFITEQRTTPTSYSIDP